MLTSTWQRWWRVGDEVSLENTVLIMLVSASNTHSGHGCEEVVGKEEGGLSMGVGQEPPTLLRKGMGRAGFGALSAPATCGWRRKVTSADCLKIPTLPEMQYP